MPNSQGARVYAAEPGSAALAALAELAGSEQGAEVAVASVDADTATLPDGSVLERLAVDQGFWFSWYDRHPATELWPQ